MTIGKRLILWNVILLVYVAIAITVLIALAL